MRTRRSALVRSPLGAAALLTTVLVTGGCEDATARQRAEAQSVIDTASRDLRVATISSVSRGDADDARRTLEGIVQALAGIGEAADGQMAAAAVLSAAANTELAGLDLAVADDLVADGRQARAIIHSAIDAAMRLEALSAGRRELSTADQRSVLTDYQRAAERELRDLQGRLAELGAPIAEREAENEQDNREASRLTDEANDLRRQAAEWGPADGLPTFEQALDREREADRFELRVARREGDLQYELRPEHDLIARRVAFLETVLADIRATMDSLTGRDSQTETDLDETRRLTATFEESIRSGLAELSAGPEQELQERYEAAERHLGKAVREATKAVSKSGRDDADAARLVLVRANEKQSRLYGSHLLSLGARRAMLERLLEAGDTFEGRDGWQSALDATVTTQDEVTQKATEALRNAREQLDRVRARGHEDQIESLKARLDLSLAGFGVESDAPPARSPASTPRAARGGDRAPAAGSGYATPEALLAALGGAGMSAEAMNRLFDACHATETRTREAIAIQRSGIDSTVAFAEAMHAQFGDAGGQTAVAGMGGGPVPAMANAHLEDRTDDRATVVFDSPQGPGTGRLELVVVNGVWMIDGDAMMAGIDDAMLAQMKQMAPTMHAMMNQLAQRIRAGEFGSPAEVMQAVMGGAGGAPGG